MTDDIWNKDEHVPMWPSYDLPEKETFYTPYLWDEKSQCAVDEDGSVICYLNALQFVKALTEHKIILFVERLLVKDDFSHFEEILEVGRLHNDKGKKAGPTVRAYATRSQGCVGVYLKSKRSAWIVERRIWDDGVLGPDQQFLRDIGRVYTLSGYSASTPGSLGEKEIRSTLPRGTRYSRPNVPLRSTLLKNKVGGRADTLECKKQYGVLYEEDINGSYPYCSLETIDPAETPTGFGGLRAVVSEAYLEKFFSYYCYASVDIPADIKKPKFGPLPFRDSKGHLTWPNRPGTQFTGWWWREELDRARQAGYTVIVHKGWGWKKSSNWLEKWARDAYKLRLELEDGTVKQIQKKKMVSAIGRFSIAPEKLTLVGPEDHVDGDIPVSIQTYAWEYVEKQWWIHIEPNPKSNSLVHVGSHIVAKARVLLYDNILDTEQTQVSVVASNFDSYYCIQPPRRPSSVGIALGQLKQHTVLDAYIHAPRYIKGIRDGVSIDNRPGTPKRTRTKSLATSRSP